MRTKTNLKWKLGLHGVYRDETVRVQQFPASCLGLLESAVYRYTVHLGLHYLQVFRLLYYRFVGVQG